MRALYFFILFIWPFYATQKYWLPIIPPYDLQSEQLYTLYLPARVKQLTQLIKQGGLKKTTDFIKNGDHDLESFLFILSTDEPKKLVAYSQKEQFFNKTAQQLQKLIFPSPTNHFEDIETTFEELISTALKGDTYHIYAWRFNSQDPVQYQVAYVHLITINTKQYIVGASVIADIIPECIIFPARTKTVLANLQEKNIDKWLDAINNDTDKYQYFEVNTTDKSYRWIANGAEPDLIGKTAAEAQLLIFKDCKTDDCNITKLLEASSYMVRRGGGFNAYLWQGTPEAQAALHISYSFPFAYKNIALYLCSGYKPPWLKDYMRTEAPQVVEKMLQLISEVGLENALSTIRKTNQSRLFVFVVEQTYPYIILEYFDPILTNKTAVEATAAAHKRHNPSVNYVKLFADMIDFVQFQDGFYAYEFTEPIAHAITKLKIGYIKSLTYNKKKYVIGATYVSLQT